MDYTFVINGDSSSRKRRAPQGACDVCKKRKKRCTHGLPSNSTDHEHVESPSAKSVPAQDAQDASASLDVSSSSREQPQDPPSVSRFIGDLNPEASLVAEQDPGSGSRDRHDVGIWVGQPSRQHDQHPHRLDGQRDQPGDLSSSGTESRATRVWEPVLPPKNSQDALADIYFSKVNVLLPILDADTFQRERNPSPALMQAICLIASKCPDAQRHCIDSNGGALPLPSFASSLYHSLKHGAHRRDERNKITLIQTLALMSLHSEGLDGAEEASINLAKAMHHAQTVGLHLGRSNGHSDSQTRLFWALWCLSKLNAALNGRPQLMSDRDIGLKLEEAYGICDPPFQVMLDISQLLSRVIENYQPTSTTDISGVEADFVRFESIMDRRHAWDLGPMTTTSLELYYHGVAIISHRIRTSTSHPTPTASSLRQELSSLQLVTMLRYISPRSLTPLPWIPYSIALAMSSFYNQLRQVRHASKRTAAREHLETCVEALEQMQYHSWSAKSMARLGRKALDQTAQVAASLPPELRRASRAGGAAESGANAWHPGAAQGRYQGNQATTLEQQDGAVAGNHQGTDDLTGFNMAYDELMDMDAVFEDFLNMNLPDFGLPFQ